MPNIFNDLLRNTARDIASKAKDALSWFKDSIENINKKEEKTDPNKIFKNVEEELEFEFDNICNKDLKIISTEMFKVI
jgi:hypothetical protein